VITFVCGNCGFETSDLEIVVEHLKRGEWHCWHKERGGFFTLDMQPHGCGRGYCETEQRARFKSALGTQPVEDFT